MDYLELIKTSDLIEFAENYNYKTNFMGEALFPSTKTDNFKMTIRRIVENGNLPVMAFVHSLDTEARIGDRPDYEELKVEKLFIKEKLNQGERLAEYLSKYTPDSEVKAFIFNDLANLYVRVLTRIELMRMQLLSTGVIVVNENNAQANVNFGYKASHNDTMTGWNDPAHDIIADLNGIVRKAKNDGYTITRALTSDKIISYICANTAIQAYFTRANILPTESNVLNWIASNFGIEFATNENFYKVRAKDTAKHRFYPENKITWIAGNEVLGKTVYGVTPEELELTSGTDAQVTSNAYVVGTMWKANDPVTTWTKASAVALPVPNDIDRLYITTIVKSE